MKKVQVLVGSLGVLAPVLGTTAPAQAAVHPTEQPAKSTGKVVSVLGASGTSAQAAATSSSSSFIGASPSTENSKVPCIGVKGYKKAKNGESLKFWSGPLGNPISYNCIGTVEGKWFSWPDSRSWAYHVKIYSHGNWTTAAYNKQSGGTQENFRTVYGQQGVHKWFRAPVRVCTDWHNTVTDSITSTICKTID